MEKLNSNETEIYKGTANMQYQKSVAAVLGYNKGGHLTLTNQRLIFIAHSLNIGQKEYYIPLKEIKLAQNGFHIFTPTPNMIKIELKSGEVYKFVVKGKEKETWKNLIVEYADKVQTSTNNSTNETIQDEESISQATISFCSTCGNKLTPGGKFCSKCGTKIV